MKVCFRVLSFLTGTLLKYYVHGQNSRQKQVVSVGGIYFYTPLLKLVLCCCKIAYNLVRKAHFTEVHMVTAGQKNSINNTALP